MKEYIVDAFADELFTGNPAAVLPCRKLPSLELMQKIAAENNYSETAFFEETDKGVFNLRWFTPRGEIDLCGHATLAAAYVVNRFINPELDIIYFNTMSGELTVRKEEYGFTMEFPTGKTKPIPVDEKIRKASNNLAVEAYFDEGDMIAVFSSEKDVENFTPDENSIKKLEGLGFIVTARSDKYDFVSRCFYPKLDILEDPVTGRAHTFLAPIWNEKLHKNIFRAKQVSERGGVLTIKYKNNKVYISGNVQLFMEGEIPFDF